MRTPYWQQVLSSGVGVPDDRSLHDLTEDLTRMLGSTSPEERDGTAYPVLATWIERGVYDDLLIGLGDGMLAGLGIGIGEQASDSVFRRSFSVLVLAECIRRDHQIHRLPLDKLLEWADGIATWFLRERDVRGMVPGKGWAHAIAHGSDAIAELTQARDLGAPELSVLLDVIADRLLLPGPMWTAGEPDRLAAAAMQALRRDVLALPAVESWLARIAAGAGRMGAPENVDPYQLTGNAENFLRSLHLQLALAPNPPALRADLLLVLIDALRATNPHLLAPVSGGADAR